MKNRDVSQKKSVLFVMNTMGRAGAERALIELLKKLSPDRFDVFLYVLIPRGELFEELPAYVKVLNAETDSRSVLSRGGSLFVAGCLLRSVFHRGVLSKACGRVFHALQKKNAVEKKKGVEKALRRMLADGQKGLGQKFDLAAAYLEGPATWYTAEKVNAVKKAAFVHVDYGKAGYGRALDMGCYEKFDRIFAVSREVKKGFTDIYPEYGNKTDVFLNIINRDSILEKSLMDGGFCDPWDGFRILSVGRLNYQKGYDVAIEAAGKLCREGRKFRWYVLGEGEERKKLEKRIREEGLEGIFILLGAAANPYPYFKQADLYVCSSRYEGKSIVIEEAQALGKAVVASRCTAIEEQVKNGVDGLIAEPGAQALAQAVGSLMDDAKLRMAYADRAGRKIAEEGSSIKKLADMLEE